VATNIRSDGLATAFSVSYDDKDLGEVALRVPGNHNVQNALAALGTGLSLGLTIESMREGLLQFQGVDRRFQRLCEVAGIIIVDDYAHHPTEIAATLQAARASYPGRRIVAAFQPHLFSRTRDFSREFGVALAAADGVFLTEIYPAREQPIPGVTADLVATSLKEAGRVLAWQGSRTDLAAALNEFVRDGDVVITIGAGDITQTGPELKRHLEGRRG
jgi:UDP-N-acetylmuramate--alanine ligase